MAGVKGRSGGHNAKTARQLKLSGGLRKNRHAGLRNPEPPEGPPQPPKPLDGDAGEEWARMIARLSSQHTLTVVDAAALYQYCRLFAETEAIAEMQATTTASIQILEESLHDFKGTDLIAAFQELTKMRALESSYINKIRQGRMSQRVYLVEFGLTPASRGRVKLPPTPDPVDEFEQFEVITGGKA